MPDPLDALIQDLDDFVTRFDPLVTNALQALSVKAAAGGMGSPGAQAAMNRYLTLNAARLGVVQIIRSLLDREGR